MIAEKTNTLLKCNGHLNRYFTAYPDAELSRQATRAVRFLSTGDAISSGKAEGWAAGIIYWLANRDRRACGLPGLLNSEVESFFGVKFGTIRKRAAQVEQLVII